MFPITSFLGIITELNTSDVSQSMIFLGHPYPVQIQQIRSFRFTEGVTANRPLTHVPLSEADRQAARWAWQYIQRNWQPHTGFVNSVDQYPWTTWWDQGSAILGIHAAYQLGIISSAEFDQKITRFLTTLKTLPLPLQDSPISFTVQTQLKCGPVATVQRPRQEVAGLCSIWLDFCYLYIFFGLTTPASHSQSIPLFANGNCPNWNIKVGYKDVSSSQEEACN